MGLGVGGVENLNERALGQRSAQQAGGGANVVGAKDDVDEPGPLDNGLTILLGHATTNGDLHVGATLLKSLELPEGGVEALIGILTNRAGVEENDVGLLPGLHRNETIGHHKSR
ncbi:unannotated protein [freshwater metagenome]|uniref:Unannotated protein n=1 Tax=freshwater metagenome TaxID=449393 RepID=A0A6J7E140_9ZZZZ